MKVLVDFPSIVKKYAPYFESCFSKEGYEHFKKALSGFIVSENKTLEGINRLFVKEVRNQSSFNRFFNRQNFDLEQLNNSRVELLQQNPKTAFKSELAQRGAIMLDNTLLKHYGQCFDKIYNLYDYVDKGFRWCHDLVTLHYSDELTDYPIDYQLWDPPDWEAVGKYFLEKGYYINKEKWDKRDSEPKKWTNYIRRRFRDVRIKHPEVFEIYKTKVNIGESLLRKFCKAYPQLNLPVVLDSGFTSAEFCEIITKELQLNYVGALKAEQTIILAGSQEKSLADFTKDLKEKHFAPNQKAEFEKVVYTFRGVEKEYYCYFANHRIRGYKKKQRLVIAYHTKELSGTPYYVISNRLDWYPSGILRIRRQRWPIETYHQEAKVEGLEKYQVRNIKAIESYIAFVVVTYSILQSTIHDDELLSSIQQRLQTEKDGTLPFIRRLMQAESVVLLIEFVFLKIQQGHSLEQVLQKLTSHII